MRRVPTPARNVRVTIRRSDRDSATAPERRRSRARVRARAFIDEESWSPGGVTGHCLTLHCRQFQHATTRNIRRSAVSRSGGDGSDGRLSWPASRPRVVQSIHYDYHACHLWVAGLLLGARPLPSATRDGTHRALTRRSPHERCSGAAGALYVCVSVGGWVGGPGHRPRGPPGRTCLEALARLGVTERLGVTCTPFAPTGVFLSRIGRRLGDLLGKVLWTRTSGHIPRLGSAVAVREVGYAITSLASVHHRDGHGCHGHGLTGT